MRLHYAETVNGRKACAAAKYLEVDVAFVRVDLRRGEQKQPSFLALNPMCRVPVLETPEGALWESNAIMCRLAREAGSDFWPQDDRQFEVLRWLFWSSEHFSRHASRLYFEYLIKPLFGLGAPDEKLCAEADGFVRQLGAILDAHLKGRRWLIGDTLTVADFAVGGTLPYAEKAKIPVGEFPEIMRWAAALDSLPAWHDPYPVAKAAA